MMNLIPSQSRRLLLPLIALLTLPALTFAQNVVRGPYLQSPTPNSIIVRWRTDIATDSSVGYATENGSAAVTTSATLTTNHAVTLNSLAADTLYNYTVGTTSQVLAGGNLSSNGDGEHFFTTSPASNTDKPTRIWVIGDSGTANADAAAVRDAYKNFTGARGTDVWLMLGDNAYSGGSDSEYQAAVFNMYPQMLRQTPVWSALGNHDGIDVVFNPPGAYPQIFSFPTAGEAGGYPSGTKNYYSFNYGNIHFVTLDSTISANWAEGSNMWTWLEADLAANTSRWTIAFWHHPHYSKGSHNSDTEVALVAMRQRALPILEAHGVDLVLTGHSHSYERSYLVDGHYGLSTTLTPAMILDDGDGKVSGDGAYLKPGPAGTPHQGAVHAVVGSSGKTEAVGTFNHPIMHESLLSLGSMVIDVSRHQLDAAFIDAAGVVKDEFTIIKDPPQVVAIDVDPWDPSNEVQPASNNSIPVAVLGASKTAGDPADFDATQINPATLKLGIGKGPNYAVPWILDVDGDSITDSIFSFKTQDAGIFCGDTELSLEGETFDGDEFVGTDTIMTSDCEDLGCHP